MRVELLSVEMVLYLAEEKDMRKRYDKESAAMREGILMGLLIDIADVFNVPIKTIQSGDRQDLTVFVRSVFYHVARAKTHYKINSLIRITGRNHHAACVHHARKVKRYFRDREPEFLALWDHYLLNSKLFTKKDFPWNE
jgi:hypothetical protein